MIQDHIFDLYGTLVDIHTDESKPMLWKRMALLLSLQGAAYSFDELHSAYLTALNDQIQKRAGQLPHVPIEHVEPDIRLVFDCLYRQKGIHPSLKLIQNSALMFRALSMGHIRLYPGVIEVLCELRAKRQGVYLLSNAQAVFTMAELDMLGLTSLFDGIVLSSDLGIKKPNKAIFDHILSKYGLRPETCLMIGNDEQADMLGAVSAGMAGRYIHTKQSPPFQGTVLPGSCQEITNLRELL